MKFTSLLIFKLFCLCNGDSFLLCLFLTLLKWFDSYIGTSPVSILKGRPMASYCALSSTLGQPTLA